MTYEYKVVSAPAKGLKAKGLKTAEARFAFAVEQVMNDHAADGWEYQRTDVLPSEERQGLTGSVTNWRNLMVFRRLVDAPETVAEPPFAEAVVEAPPVRVEPFLRPPAVTSAVPAGAGVAAEPSPVVTEPVYEEGAEETRPA